MSLNNSIVEIIENDNYSVVSNDSFDSKDSVDLNYSFDLNDKDSSDDNIANGNFQIISESNLACFACDFKGVRTFSLTSEYCLCTQCY